MKTFFEIVDSTNGVQERTEFRKRIISACEIEYPTWYSWMRRRKIPKPSQKLISIELGMEVSTLFPSTVVNENLK